MAVMVVKVNEHTTENDRLLGRFVRLIGVSQIRETVMNAPREPSAGIKFA